MWRCRSVECDAVMIAKIARLLRTPAHGKIGRVGADDAADRTDVGRNHAAVRQDAGFDYRKKDRHRVEAIHHPIFQISEGSLSMLWCALALRNHLHFADRGRDVHYWAPPAQNRTCGFPAYGSHLGWLTAKRSL